MMYRVPLKQRENGRRRRRCGAKIASLIVTLTPRPRAARLHAFVDCEQPSKAIRRIGFLGIQAHGNILLFKAQAIIAGKTCLANRRAPTGDLSIGPHPCNHGGEKRRG